MIETPFKFKKFILYHQKSTLKVGTDAILLGAWACTENAEKILEIGCGCGIITLMLAQRSNATIDAVEIDFNSTEEAKRNAEISEWKNRINIQNISFQDFIKDKKEVYDLIVSNPPYFSNSLKSNDLNKNLAKHNDSLSYKELASGISKLLKANGKATIILSKSESKTFKNIALENGLYCNKEMEVYPKTGLKSNRLLMQFEKQKLEPETKKISILDVNNKHTTEFIDLCKDFYLNF
jgi:tRNA1Val (adenine37-N6)-methyltransferase